MLKITKYLTSILLCLLVLQGLGCVGKKTIRSTIRTGEREVIEKNKKRPGWVVTPPKATSEMMYAVGNRTKATMLDAGNTDARMTAIGKISDAARVEFQRMYERSRIEEGLPSDDKDIGWVVNDGIRAISHIVVSGVKEKDIYWEKYKEYEADGSVNYYYDFWTLVSISSTDFMRAVNGTLDGLRKKAIERKNKRADKLIEKMREDFGSSPAFSTESEK